jgi:hypothetical protein
MANLLSLITSHSPVTFAREGVIEITLARASANLWFEAAALERIWTESHLPTL